MTSPSSSFALPFLWFVAWLLHATATAQCALTCAPLARVPDADGPIRTSCAWDPDGAGPQPELVVFGGSFRVLGNAPCPGIATYDPATGDCAAIGAGITGAFLPATAILALTVTANHELVAAGSFTSIGGVAATNIARWNGSAWQPFGTGIPYPVRAVTALPNGDVVAGGLGAVVHWNGTTWSLFGAALSGNIGAIVTMSNGDVVVGGGFLFPGGIANLARWDGTAWTSFGGPFDNEVLALLPQPNGDLVAAGRFLVAGGVSASRVAHWNGTTWSALGAGVADTVHALARDTNGDLIAGGLFASAGGVPANNVARWNGTTWSGMGSGVGVASPYFSRPVRTLAALPGGGVVAGGEFLSTGSDADHVARWNGTQWTQLRAGTGGAVLCSAETASGDLLVGGEFTTVEGVAATHVARLSNGVWQPLGAGVNGSVNAILPLPNGDVVVGGGFTSAGSVPASNIARWDGTAWHAFGAGLPGAVWDLARDTTGRILAGGTFLDRVAVWDGLTWHGTGVAAGFAQAGDLVTLPGGDVLAAIGQASAAVCRWDGIAWAPLTGGGGSVGALAVANGVFYTGRSGGVRHWSGVSWNALPGTFSGQVTELLALPDGGLLAAGDFTAIGSAPIAGIARWNGTAWSAVGAGATGRVADLRWRMDGSGVVVSGAFHALAGVSCGGLGELVTSCPSAAASAGAGCSGSGGANVLTATSLPWVGGTFTSVASGLPATGLAVEVRGLGALAQSIAALLPQGVAGCVLSTTPDLLALHLPAAGSLALEVGVPNTATLVGATFRQQVVPFELDAGGAITAVTTTNSLQLTIGRF